MEDTSLGRLFLIIYSFFVLSFFFTGGRHISRLAVPRDPCLLHVKNCRESAHAVGKGRGGEEGGREKLWRAFGHYDTVL